MAEKFESIEIAELMVSSGVGFGTSGARGLVEAMTDRVCYGYTVGFLQYLEKCGGIRPGDSLAIAGDLRPSTPRIMAATVRAATDLGYVAVNCGEVPSPAVALYGLRRGIASLMITGSHIPDDRNGIKFNKPSGEILKVDEARIREQTVHLAAELFDEKGMFVEERPLPDVDGGCFREYVSRYLDFFPSSCLSGRTVLVYEHSSVAATALVEVLEGLGATVLRRGASDVFVPVDTEAIRSEDIALASQWAGQDTFDMIVSTDGDGDRPLVGDEHGVWLRGDVMGVLVARFLEADAVVTPVSSNTVLEKSGWFTHTLRTRIGSPFVIEGMIAAAETAECVVGYEANGGFLLHSDLRRAERELAALPTRDALIVPLCLLLYATQQGMSVAELVATLPPRFTASGRLKEFPGEVSERNIAALRAADGAALCEQFPELGRLVAIDDTDGLRMTFENDEIVHLRPSGNAPELRCYNEAGDAAQAAVRNERCLAWLDGWRN